MIKWMTAREAIRALDPDVEWTLPPRVTCLRCGRIFEPTVDVNIQYNARYGVFFFYCEEHDHETV